MAWLAALGGAGGAATGAAADAAATGATGAAAIPAGNTAAGGIASGTGMLSNPGAMPGGGQPPAFGDWLNQQGFWQNQMGNALGGAMNQKSSLPSPMGSQAMQMQPLPPMTGQPGASPDASSMAPFLQALARGQQTRFGATPFGFGVPSGMGQ